MGDGPLTTTTTTTATKDDATKGDPTKGDPTTRDEGNTPDGDKKSAPPTSTQLLVALEEAFALARLWLDHDLGGLGITRVDLIYLEHIAKRHDEGFDPAMTDFRELVERGKSRVSAVSERLATNGLIEKRRNARNGRVKNLVLTEDGMRCLEEARRRVDAVADELFAGLGAKEKGDLHYMLGSVHDS